MLLAATAAPSAIMPDRCCVSEEHNYSGATQRAPQTCKLKGVCLRAGNPFGSAAGGGEFGGAAAGGHEARAASAPAPAAVAPPDLNPFPGPSGAPAAGPPRGASAPAQDVPGSLDALLDRLAPGRLLSSTAQAWGDGKWPNHP